MKKFWGKYKIIILKIGLVLFGLVLFYSLLAGLSYDAKRKTVFGVTFSKSFAEYLQLNWKEVYLAMLDDLQIKYLRLPTYWTNIEPQPGQYNFTDIDWQISEAAKREVKIILVVGRRQPRWPECHDPGWVSQLSPEEARQRNKQAIETVVKRYKNNQTIEIWQVENEPFLDFFGECPKITQQQLKDEVSFVKSLDSRPVLITDSGELSTWFPAIKMGDLFGSTLYRLTYNKYIGYFRYIFVPASYYRVKAFVWGRSIDTTYIAELQAEPWFPNGPIDTPIAEHYKTMNDQILKDNADYARKTNLSRVYFWGVEWWYWIKTTQNNSALWETAKPYFK